MIHTLDRRQFLRFLAVGVPAVEIERHLGLWDRVRSYFFGGFTSNAWGVDAVSRFPIYSRDGTLTSEIVSFQIDKMMQVIPTLFERDSVLEGMFSTDSTIRVATTKEVRQFARRA